MTKAQRPLNVLIFPGGIENGLEIQNSLRWCKEVRLFSASSSTMNHAFFAYRNNHVIGDVRTEGWIDELNAVVHQNDIDLIYPANSLVIDALSPNRHQLNATIVLPNHEVIELTRSKRQTTKALATILPTPELFDGIDEIKTYPVFAKPDHGYGSQGAVTIQSRSEASKIDFAGYVVQEYLPGREYTVDCFSDRQGRLLFSGARERTRIRMATSMHADVVSEDLERLLRDYATRILSRIPISGAWFFQVKEDSRGTLRLLEIDVRIAGTMCFNRCRGVNFPLLSVFQSLGRDVSLMINPQPLSLDRALRNRYRFEYDYETVYVDLDDTIIIHDRLNTEVIQFLFQCVNNRKKLVLISKCLQKDKTAYLKKHKIESLFDEIIWLEESQSKADWIHPGKAIFIDDSFSQRKEVHNRHGIPTFDPSMVECLLDDRI